MTVLKRVLQTFLALAVTAALGYIGIFTGLLPAGTMDNDYVRKGIVAQIEGVTDAPFRVTCPQRIWKMKNHITDCVVTLKGSGESTSVYVTPVDHRGHYTTEIINPSIFRAND